MLAASVRGIAKVVPLFTCSKCGHTAPGTGSVEIEFHGLSELTYLANRVEAPRTLIPVGWSSNGTAGVTCPAC